MGLKRTSVIPETITFRMGKSSYWWLCQMQSSWNLCSSHYDSLLLSLPACCSFQFCEFHVYSLTMFTFGFSDRPWSHSNLRSFPVTDLYIFENNYRGTQSLLFSFIFHSFNESLFIAYFILSPALDTGNIVVNKTNKFAVIIKFAFYWGR